MVIACAVVAHADPRVTSWVRGVGGPVSPEVHSVRTEGGVVVVESAGLSLQSFGPLEARPYDGDKGVRRFSFRIPLRPEPAKQPVPAPPGIIGAFVTGVPIYNPASVLSYRDQNLWHVDAVALWSKTSSSGLLAALLERRGEHSPLIGFALDGYPIYGPYGWDAEKRVVPLRPSYRVRREVDRRADLTPAQEGPAPSGEFPPGVFVEDYEYAEGSGDLDRYNGRFAVTPEFPGGTYAYFLATDGGGRPAYPYLVGPSLRGRYDAASLEGLNALSEDAGLRLLSNRPRIRAGDSAAFTFVTSHRVLEKVHEKTLHVLLISDDMSGFEHVHPEPLQHNVLRLEHTFPRGGVWWVYADFTPPGGAQTIARFRLDVAGPERSAAPASPAREVTVSGLRVTLDASPTAGRDVPLRFTLHDAQTGYAVADLEPYLGAWGHIMILSEDKRDFIHAHPKEQQARETGSPWEHTHAIAPGPSPAEIETVTGFSRPGRYRMWLQVQRRGQVITAPFAMEVAAGAVAAPPRAVPKDALRVEVSSRGYSPARIAAPAGKPVKLAFTRADAQNCGGKVVFPGLGLQRDLPPGETTVVELPASARGELRFSCGMGMYRGAVVVR